MKTVIVTGGNRGLGFHTCLAFARAGYKVYAGIRNIEAAKKLIEISDRELLNVEPKVLDLTKPNLFAGFVEDIISDCGGIDVLVNNAGIIVPGAFEDLSEQQMRNVMETNFFGALLLTRSVLPAMRAQLSGKVIMVSSLSGLAGLPGDVIYSASKFALEGATEALRHEVSRWGIDVALVEAGQYATSLFEKSFESNDLLPSDYPKDSPYLLMINARQQAIRESIATSSNGESVGKMMVEIANSDGSQLRWQADELSLNIASTLLAQSDSERDLFLRGASQIDWWIEGQDSPD